MRLLPRLRHRALVRPQSAGVGLALAGVLTMLLAFVSPSAVPDAGAVNNCAKVVPIDAVFGTGGTVGAFTASGYQTFTGAAAAEGAAAGAGTGAAAGATVSSAGTVALAAATFAGAFMGTCKFLDWTGWMEPKAETALPSGLTVSAHTACSALGVTAALSTDRCRILSWQSLAATWNAVVGPQGSSMTAGGVTLPALTTSRPQYKDWGSGSGLTTKWVGTDGSTICQYNFAVSAWTPSVTACTATRSASAGQVVLVETCHNASGQPAAYGGTSACSQPPDSLVALKPLSEFNTPWVAVVARVPDVQTNGWRRVWRTISRCVQPATGATQQLSVESLSFYDFAPSERIPMVTCPTGYIPSWTKVFKLPQSYTSTDTDLWNTFTSTKQSYGYLAFELKLPTAVYSATGPAWQVCLSSGSTCGAPALDGTGACVWGGFGAPAGFCDAARQAGLQTSTQAVAEASITPGTTGTPNVYGTVTQQSQATTTTAGGTTTTGGGTTTTTTPAPPPDIIEPGTDGDCWPDGWGLLRPDKWVLQPIKCAAQWAFVPPAGSLDDVKADFQAVWDGEDLAPLREGVETASDSSISFGSWETSAPACFDVMGAELCPQDWAAAASSIPGWFNTLVMAGLWVWLARQLVRWM